MTADIVIVGAGPAGLSAARTLAAAGLPVMLVDEGRKPGGQIYRQPPDAIRRSAAKLYGFEKAKAARLHCVIANAADRLDYRPETSVWAVSGKTLNVVGPSGAASIAWDSLIIATGAMDRVIPFQGWTLPGVFTLGGAQVLLKSQAAGIGSRPVFAGTGPLLYLVAWQYAQAGIRPAAILDTSTFADGWHALPGLIGGGRTFAKGLFYLASLRADGIAIHRGVRAMRASTKEGRSVNRVSWQDAENAWRDIACDALGVGFGLRSETQLADLCAIPFVFDALQRQWLPQQDAVGRSSVPGIYLAGDGAKVRGADIAELTGELAARTLLADRGDGSQRPLLDRLAQRLRRSDRFRNALDGVAFPYPKAMAASVADDLVVCRCENICAGDIRRAARDLGAQELNRAKAFSRVGMGRCQGRVCGSAAAEILAAELSCPIDQVGRLRGQAPIRPLSLAALASEAA